MGGLQGLCALAAPVVFAACIALIFLCPGQVLAMALSAMLSAMPGLPAYSAVLLMMPHTASESPWEAIHWASLAVLGVLYLAATLVPLLRAEHPKPGCVVRFAVAALEAAQRLARGVCIVAAWVFTAVLLDAAGGASFGWAQQHLVVQSEAAWGFWSAGLLGLVTSGRGLVLFLHVLGLLCTEARQHTVDSLGHEMLPLLLGTNRARALSLEALVKDHGRRFLRRIPTLRRWTPPRTFVALAVTLRRTAVIVFPALAFSAAPRWSEFDRRLPLVDLRSRAHRSGGGHHGQRVEGTAQFSPATASALAPERHHTWHEEDARIRAGGSRGNRSRA